MEKPRIAFWGTSNFSVFVLEELKIAGFLPTLIITTPDKPKGRKLIVTPPPIKIFAEREGILFIQPKNFQNIKETKMLRHQPFDLFIIASYGKIIPKEILKLPKSGTLNVHPSLLPKFRGPSPIASQILADDNNTGVSIILIDEEIDHGSVIAKRKIKIFPWPPKASELRETLGRAGGKLLTEVILAFISGQIIPTPQDHLKATFTKKIKKEDGLIDLSTDAYKNFLKIRAYEEWPGTYFFVKRQGKPLRVIIKDATFKNGELAIIRVIPEGGREMGYTDFLRGLKK